MPAVAGRTSEPRTVTVTTALNATGITAPAGTFAEEDAGRTITGANIPAGATLASVESDTAATLSAAATAAATVSAELGDAGLSYGFRGWSPESDAESETYSIAGGASANAPGRITDPNTGFTRRWRA